MKKILILLCLFYFSGVISAIAQPQCPEGTQSTDVVLTVNNCDYKVIVCYKCGSETEAGYLSIWGFAKLDPECEQGWLFQEVVESINNQIMSSGIILTICEGQTTPCPQTIFFLNQLNDCWRKKLDPYYGILYYPCLPSDLCTTAFTICWDGANYVLTEIYNSQSNGYGCPAIMESGVPDPSIPNEESECFSISTPCE